MQVRCTSLAGEKNDGFLCNLKYAGYVPVLVIFEALQGSVNV